MTLLRTLTLILLTSLLPLATQAEIQRFKQVSPWLYRGSQPETDADYDQLVAAGVKTIINLRQLAYPVAREKRRWKEAVERYNKSHPNEAQRPAYFEWHPFSAMMVPSKDTILEILHVTEQQNLLPAFVHCQLGRDRTGLVVALYQIHMLGMDVADAKREWIAMGANKKWRPMFWTFDKYSDWSVLTSDGVPWATAQDDSQTEFQPDHK